jgi:DNA-directed RNA polymerase subunit E'/Rpb7
MEYTTIIEQSDDIIIEPFDLDRIKECISKKIHDKVSTCSEENGYVISIEDIKWSLLTNKISRISGKCIFNVHYDVRVLKPKILHVYPCKVNRILSEGVFCEYNTIRILIHASVLSEWVFENNSFKHVSGDVLLVGSIVNVRITALRYDNHKYQCIGVLNNNLKE